MAARDSQPINPARRLAVKVLARIERKRAFANLALPAALGRAHLTGSDAALATDLVYGVCRRRNTLDWWIDRHARRPIATLKADLRSVLRLAAYEAWQRAGDRAFVVGSQYTELAREVAHEPAAGFVNALCRQLTAAPPPLPEGSDAESLALRHSHPAWLVARWLDRFGSDTTCEMCRANNEPPALTLRLNTLVTSAEYAEAALHEGGVEFARGEHPLAYRIAGGRADELPGFDRGWWVPQGEGSMLIADLLDPQPGETVVDACAAPGGKTTHLAARMENRGRLLAIELHPSRLRLVRDACARCRVSIAELQCGDFRDLARAVDGVVDRILLDAPCSGTGTLRRKPDLRWRLRETQIAELAVLQLELLHAAAALVKPGGVIVYATCSVEAEENEQVVEQFLTARSDFDCAPDPRRLWPHREGTDGMFMARLVRSS